MRLPDAIDPTEFDTRYRREWEAWRPAVVEVCAAHGLPCHRIEPFADGSNLVAEVEGRWVVKLFPPFHRSQWESERRVLPRFTALPLPVPELLAAGEREDGFTYVVLSRLPGRGLEGRWEVLPRSERARLLGDIGSLMAAAHRVPVGDLADLPPRFDTFLAAQLAGCRQRHARLGAPAWVVEQADAFLARWLGALELAPPHVILTGEYTPFNLLHDEVHGRPVLTGMIDLGDAMIGPAVYDLLGPAVFLAGGEPALLEPFFRARALLPWPLPVALRRGLLALLLLHRYSHLDLQIRVDGWRLAGRLEALADRLFGA